MVSFFICCDLVIFGPHAIDYPIARSAWNFFVLAASCAMRSTKKSRMVSGGQKELPAPAMTDMFLFFP